MRNVRSRTSPFCRTSWYSRSFVDHARSVGLHVDARIRSGRLAVDRHPEPHRLRGGTARDAGRGSGSDRRSLRRSRVQHSRSGADRPIAFERPVVELQRRCCVSFGRIPCLTARRDEPVRAPIADVGFRRSDACNRRGGLGSARDPLRHLRGLWSAPGLGEQLADDHLGLRVTALAEMMVALPSLRIEEVVRRPVIVLERRPDDAACCRARPGSGCRGPRPPCGHCRGCARRRTPARGCR